MATKPKSMRILAVLLLISVWTVASLQPGIAQVTILEPEAPKEDPSLWATPRELDLGPIGVGESSQAQTVTVTNTGDALLANFTGGNVPFPFETTNNCAAGVLPDSSCQYSFWFTPASAGDFSATATISTNAGPFSITLHAQAVNPEFTVSPLSLDFGTIPPTSLETIEENTADQQIVVVRNIGMADLSGFSEGSVSDPFTVTNDCPASLPPGEKCQYYYNFFPTVEDSFSEESTVTTNAGSFTINMKGESKSLPLSGQFATPLEIDFGPVGIANPASAQDVVLTNLSITDSINNFNISDLEAPFSLSQDCTPSVAAGGTCTYTYNFAPLTTGEFTATSSTTNSAGTFVISLRGTGVSPALSASPLVLDFGPVLAGDTSDPQIVTVRNTGKSTVTNIITNDVNPPFSGSQNCAGGLLPGETCELTFYYSPTSGVYTETTTTISTNGMASGIVITLMGGVKPPQVTKQFIPNTIPADGVSTLQITIHDPNPAATLFEVALTDTFPAGMVIATPLFFNLSPECGTPTFQPVAGKGSFSLADGTILGGKTCQIDLHVTAPLPGEYVNTIDEVSSRYGPGEVVSATLKVGIFNYIPYISK